MNRAAAQRIADEIRDYWHARGDTHVVVWVERGPFDKSNNECVNAIRSNLVAGQPPRVEAQRRRRA